MIRRPRLPAPGDFTAPSHSPLVAARLGLWLGVAFGLCFVTGLLSHYIQHPPGWFTWPTRPVNLYRITQGVHVLSGVAAIPLLLAKLWSVYPRLFARPPLRQLSRLLAHALERICVLVLVCAAFFELVTGLFNVAQSYPWGFFFPAAHYAVAWLAVGALLVHIAVKLPVAHPALTTRLSQADTAGVVAPGPDDRDMSARRAFLRTSAGVAGVAVLATAGVTVPWLRRVSPLAWRTGAGPQGMPINRTADAAGIVVPPDWRLAIVWPGGRHTLSLAELAALPQRTAELPIACVEGWSASARWTGVPIVDLLRRAGAPTSRPVRISSLETNGLYARSTLPATHAGDPLTLLALRINDEELSPDHGYPCRLIAPSRPGVLQTKWVARLEVLT
ncbi:sulfoxide reductase catalytic subunit YedY [Micromonospora coriariae]|uniref:Sulfoxide reductase catalytic subunit YedY n=1 Tax=Micromonospora coriariae TaxID=285665 RepID=A0A1C4Y9Z9_9ACTN|nr:molybdopterin-dependent oxidoreductase [Micromonospora coriariae]SCF17547.1 sulfoxide reductase catalytic subunit YedY [Micromonospora coriariae]